MKTAAQIISWVFLPLFMPVYALLMTMFIPSESKSIMAEQGSLSDMMVAHKLHIILLYIVLSVLAPGFSLLMLKRQKQIESVELDNKNERSLPITLTVIYCSMLGIFLWMQIPQGRIPQVIFALPWAGALASLIAAFINRYEKISLHGIGAGLLFGFLVMYFHTQDTFNFNLIVLSVLIGGIVLSARMYLEKHSLREAVSGYLLGVAAIVLVLTFFPNSSLNL